VPPVPDFDIYLSTKWRDLLGHNWTNVSYLKMMARERPYSALVVEWLGGGVLNAGRLNMLVNNLLPNTTYHFRAVAVGEGTS
jgi:hypothetical protein